MTFDKNLKKEVEPLARQYAETKDTLTDAEREKLEERILHLIEGYVFSSLWNRPYYLREDMEQAARVGVIKSLRKYSPEKGKFCTWVMWQIRDSVNRDKSSQWIKVPAYMRDHVNRLHKFYIKWSDTHEDAPSDEEILRELHWTSSLLAIVRHTLSLHEVDCIIDSEEVVDKEKLDTQMDIQKALEQLPEVTRQIILDIFFQEESIFTVSQKLSMSEEEVENIIEESKSVLCELLKGYASDK
jgi:RNA polymerase sigma factor (sigma-70 family)